MKVLALCVLTLAILLVSANKYDPKNHQNGHELEVSLREDEDTIFVIMWYMSNARDDVVRYNNGNKTDISSKTSTKDNVSFSMIDMSIEGHAPDPYHKQMVKDEDGNENEEIVPLPKNPEEDYSDLFLAINGDKLPFISEGQTAPADTTNGLAKHADPDDVASYLLVDGPIVNVIRKQKGVKITGKGLASEVADQVDEMNDLIKKDDALEARQEAQAKSAATAAEEKSGSNNSAGSLDDANQPTQGTLDDIF